MYSTMLNCIAQRFQIDFRLQLFLLLMNLEIVFMINQLLYKIKTGKIYWLQFPEAQVSLKYLAFSNQQSKT